MKQTLVVSLLLVAVGGCAPWVLVDGRYRMESQGFEVELPAGWRRAALVEDSLLITRDGLILQHVRIERIGVGHDLKHTKKKFATGMLPQDVAEVELEEGPRLFTNLVAVANEDIEICLLYTSDAADVLRV